LPVSELPSTIQTCSIVALSTNSGYTYFWSTAATTQSITVNQRVSGSSSEGGAKENQTHTENFVSVFLFYTPQLHHKYCLTFSTSFFYNYFIIQIQFPNNSYFVYYFILPPIIFYKYKTEQYRSDNFRHRANTNNVLAHNETLRSSEEFTQRDLMDKG
jgi:hypothetical protein